MTAPKRKTRVLFTVAGLPAGGAERQVVLLLRSLDRDVIEPKLLIFNATEKIHYREVFDGDRSICALGLSGRNPARLLWPMVSGIAGMVRDFAPDAVWSTLNVANHATRISRLLLRWRAPVVTNVRIDFREGYARRDRLAERLLWRQSAYIVCNAPTARDQMIADLGIPENRIGFVPNGIDPKFFADDAGAPPPWWPSDRMALCIGRFTAQKNQLGLVRALAGLEKEGALGEWRFVLVGEGPLEAEIRSAIAKAGLSARITVRPPIADPRPLYRAARLVILPSLYEGMPNVALEAQAMCRPVAIAAAANAAGVVAPEQGFVLAGDLAAALAPVLALSDAALGERGAAARRRMAAEFSAAAMVERMQGILLRMAQSTRNDQRPMQPMSEPRP